MHRNIKEGIRLLILLTGFFASSSTAFQTSQFGLRPTSSKIKSEQSTMFFMSLSPSPADEKSAAVVAVPITKKSLASSFVVSMGQPSQTTSSSFQWTFSPIDQINLGNQITGGIGFQAIQAMGSNIDSSSASGMDGSFKLVCQIEESRIIVEAEIDVKQATDDVHALAAILSRIMIQSALKHLSKQGSGDEDVTIVVPCANNPTETCTEIYSLEALMAPNGHAALFAAVLPDANLNNIEMSNMVDAEGEPCGYLPRPLLHKFNVLHRGIGVVVCRDAHIAQDEKTPPDVYVHQRTDTKRIFPSLFDMFVGGVATAGESLELTAEREVGEELNLTRPSLSEPLFRCTICTSYNRCVVTAYTYKFDSAVDKISWQDEEVQWGDFVAYDVVQKSGALSIDRLLAANAWPGKETNAMEALNHVDNTITRDEDNWDYVPDGLLVWVAWLQWLSK